MLIHCAAAQDIDKKMVIQGFAALRVNAFMHACEEGGKRFIIPVPEEGAPCIHIKIDDRRAHAVRAIESDSEKAVVDTLQTKWGWTFIDRAESGSNVRLRFRPTGVTTSEMIEDLIESKNILNVELTPESWNVSYIIPRSFPNSIDQIKRRHPERFKIKSGHAGKKWKKGKGSRFRRF